MLTFVSGLTPEFAYQHLANRLEYIGKLECFQVAKDNPMNLDKRDLLAAFAMHALLSHGLASTDRRTHIANTVRSSYEMADAMIAASKSAAPTHFDRMDAAAKQAEEESDLPF